MLPILHLSDVHVVKNGVFIVCFNVQHLDASLKMWGFSLTLKINIADGTVLTYIGNKHTTRNGIITVCIKNIIYDKFR